MNVERMLHLADQLANPTDPKLRLVTFNMADFSSSQDYVEDAISCGTAACIGGYACILFGAEGATIHGAEAGVLLDLTIDQARALFYNQFGYISKEHLLNEITVAQAVEAIRRMVREHVDSTIASLDFHKAQARFSRETADAVCR